MLERVKNGKTFRSLLVRVDLAGVFLAGVNLTKASSSVRTAKSDLRGLTLVGQSRHGNLVGIEDADLSLAD